MSNTCDSMVVAQFSLKKRREADQRSQKSTEAQVVRGGRKLVNRWGGLAHGWFRRASVGEQQRARKVCRQQLEGQGRAQGLHTKASHPELLSVSHCCWLKLMSDHMVVTNSSVHCTMQGGPHAAVCSPKRGSGTRFEAANKQRCRFAHQRGAVPGSCGPVGTKTLMWVCERRERRKKKNVARVI